MWSIRTLSFHMHEEAENFFSGKQSRIFIIWELDQTKVIGTVEFAESIIVRNRILGRISELEELSASGLDYYLEWFLPFTEGFQTEAGQFSIRYGDVNRAVCRVLNMIS